MRGAEVARGQDGIPFELRPGFGAVEMSDEEVEPSSDKIRGCAAAWINLMDPSLKSKSRVRLCTAWGPLPAKVQAPSATALVNCLKPLDANPEPDPRISRDQSLATFLDSHCGLLLQRDNAAYGGAAYSFWGCIVKGERPPSRLA